MQCSLLADWLSIYCDSICYTYPSLTCPSRFLYHHPSFIFPSITPPNRVQQLHLLYLLNLSSLALWKNMVRSSILSYCYPSICYYSLRTHYHLTPLLSPLGCVSHSIGIGTDATVAQHIETIKTREYVKVRLVTRRISILLSTLLVDLTHTTHLHRGKKINHYIHTPLPHLIFPLAYLVGCLKCLSPHALGYSPD